MPLVPVHWLYRRLGIHYPAAFFLLQLSVGTLVTAGALGLVTIYYDASWGEFVRLLAITEAITLVALSLGSARAVPRLRPIKTWIMGRRDPRSTREAWVAAVNMPMRMLREGSPLTAVVAVPPCVVAVVLLLDLSWTALVPLLGLGAIAAAYAAVLQYFAIELGLRPVVDDVAARLPADVSFRPQGLSLRAKLIGMLPLFSVVTGVVVAAFTSDSESSSLGLSLAVTLAVAFTLALEMTMLLASSILRPLEGLGKAIATVREGRYEARVPVTTSDELGELADGFNRMAAGLAERERLREAFGTYLDRDVAEYILSEGVSPRGVELDVSLLFCDVRDFSGFAARAEASQVVACLNELFEAVVPIVARHGGHVDKFVGDGLLAVFGAPEPFPDHADRALAAGLEMIRVTEEGAAGELRVGVGINSGGVVAGAIGGAGRLNFSVIGDAVNVAARVESATRESGDSLLLTAETRERLRRAPSLVPRGEVMLAGRDEPIEIYAPADGAARPEATAPAVERA
jgi:adenylate cyclase